MFRNFRALSCNIFFYYNLLLVATWTMPKRLLSQRLALPRWHRHWLTSPWTTMFHLPRTWQPPMTRIRSACNTTGSDPLAYSSSSSSSSPFMDYRVRSTYKWFETVVIGQKLCPFAPPFQRNPESMRVVCAPENANRTQVLELVRQEVFDLVGPDTTTATTIHETTLVILDLPQWSNDFHEFVRLSWDLQEQVVEQAGLVGTLQLVLFHPLATHQTYAAAGEDDSPADYTIRSPFPTIHLLREVDVLRAVEGGYPNLATLPMRNQGKFIQQGLETCKRRLDDCYLKRI